jgi:hypothetical protein
VALPDGGALVAGTPRGQPGGAGGVLGGRARVGSDRVPSRATT